MDKQNAHESVAHQSHSNAEHLATSDGVSLSSPEYSNNSGGDNSTNVNNSDFTYETAIKNLILQRNIDENAIVPSDYNGLFSSNQVRALWEKNNFTVRGEF